MHLNSPTHTHSNDFDCYDAFCDFVEACKHLQRVTTTTEFLGLLGRHNARGMAVKEKVDDLNLISELHKDGTTGWWAKK